MKKTLVEVGTIVLGLSVLGGLYYHQQQSNKKSLYSCPSDVMMCPDGTYIRRTGENCEFKLCTQEVPLYMKKSELKKETAETLATSTFFTKNTHTQPSQKKQPNPTSIIELFTRKTESTLASFGSVFTSTLNEGVTKTTESFRQEEQKTQNPQTQTEPTQVIIDETRYLVVNNTIVNASNSPLYTIPQTQGSGSTYDTSTWQTHEVNVVPVGQVPPVVGAIPIDGTVGKYYLSENSFGNVENCEFSNRVYILDTVANTKTLLYEENSATLTKEDPRACNSEIYLLATEGNKLILKYHTIGTNMTCDSTWSEPEKTWYLTVDHLNYGTYRYVISYDMYTQAQELENTCRATIESSTTPLTASTTVSG